MSVKEKCAAALLFDMDRRDFLTRTSFAAAAPPFSLPKTIHAATAGLQPTSPSNWAKRTLVYEQQD